MSLCPLPTKTIGLTPIDSGYADDDHATDDHATSDYDTHASDDHRRRWLAGGGGGGIHYTNTGSDGEATFIMFGWMLLCTAIGNYIMSRWVEIRLLRKAGCNSTNDYQERLCVIEKHFMEAKVSFPVHGGGTGKEALGKINYHVGMVPKKLISGLDNEGMVSVVRCCGE